MKLTHALAVKLVDTKGLKSLPFMKCHLESAQGTLKINNQKKINEFNDGFFILIFIIKLI